MKSIFQSNNRSRRNKPNPQNDQLEEHQPFFGGSGGFIQPKLTVGQPDDAYEREADAVAENVVASAELSTTPAGVQRMPITPLQSGSLQRLATPEEDKMPSTNDERMAEDKRIQEKTEPGATEEKKEEPVQMMTEPEKKEEPVQMMEAPEEKDEDKGLQAKSDGQAGTQAHANLSARLSSQKGGGEPLPDATKTQMEQGIGTDFSDVRIHTDSEAEEMNKDLHAQAFTHGQDIYFNSGKYNPESKDGQKLLAHELTHVVQQGGGQGEAVQQKTNQDMIQRWSWPWEDEEPAAQGRTGEEAQRERGKGQKELDRRVSGDNKGSDGSGKWGAEAEDRGMTDYANREMWFQVANAAELGGYTHAARHMRHYLGNTGSPISVPVDDMIRDVPALQASYSSLVTKAKLEAEKTIKKTKGVPNHFSLTGQRLTTVYCQKSVSADWFFAIGGFTHWYTAEVTAIKNADGTFSIEMTVILHVYDQYNWDHGKSVSILGITVKDDQLGRLHRVGLAREFPVTGSSSPEIAYWNYNPKKSTSDSEEIPDPPVSNDRSGGRTDPGRERK